MVSTLAKGSNVLRGDGMEMGLRAAPPAASHEFMHPHGTQDVREGFHNPRPNYSQMKFFFPLRGKEEGSRKDMASPGTGHFKQREVSCKIGNRKSLTHYGVRQPRLLNPAEEEQDRSPAGGAGPLLAPGAKGVSKWEGWAQSP